MSRCCREKEQKKKKKKKKRWLALNDKAMDTEVANFSPEQFVLLTVYWTERQNTTDLFLNGSFFFRKEKESERERETQRERERERRFCSLITSLATRKDRRKKILLTTNSTFRPHGLPQQNREQSGEEGVIEYGGREKRRRVIQKTGDGEVTCDGTAKP